MIPQGKILATKLNKLWFNPLEFILWKEATKCKLSCSIGKKDAGKERRKKERRVGNKTKMDSA